MKSSSKSVTVRGGKHITATCDAVRASQKHASTTKPQRTKRTPRASLRANSAATRALYAAAEISTASKRVRRSALKQSVVHLDDVELEAAWQACVRGDYVTASERINRTLKRRRASPVKRAKGWTPWRNALLPRRK